MRLVIIPGDKIVGKDGLFYHNLDLSSVSIPSNVRVLQWNERGDDKGHIEFKDTSFNEDIDVLPAWANECVALWEEANSHPPVVLSPIVPITP